MSSNKDILQRGPCMKPLPTAMHYAIIDGQSVPLYTEAQMREMAAPPVAPERGQDAVRDALVVCHDVLEAFANSTSAVPWEEFAMARHIARKALGTESGGAAR